MNRSTAITAGLALLCAFQAGILCSKYLIPVARADEPSAAAASPLPSQLVCRLFSVSLDKPDTFDTADATTDVGSWVKTQAQAGRQFYSVDFEIGQKNTGYPEGFVQVCVYSGAP